MNRTEGVDNMSKQKDLEKFIEQLSKLDPKQIKINWDHPKMQQALLDHEKFKRFMGWKHE